MNKPVPAPRDAILIINHGVWDFRLTGHNLPKDSQPVGYIPGRIDPARAVIPQLDYAIARFVLDPESGHGPNPASIDSVQAADDKHEDEISKALNYLSPRWDEALELIIGIVNHDLRDAQVQWLLEGPKSPELPVTHYVIDFGQRLIESQKG